MEMRLPFVVRRMEFGDVPSVMALARSLDKWFNPEGLARIAEDLTSPSGYVAVRRPATLGFVTWKAVDEEVAELTWMGVSETQQRRGIGTVLLASLVVDLRRAGYHFLEVSTVADNVEYEPYARTRRFYRARGFVDHRVDALYWGAGNDRYDRLVLRLNLATPGSPRP